MSDAAIAFGLSKRDLQTMEGIFQQVPSIEEVWIFGSRAKGTARTGSDIDLAIMNETGSPEAAHRLRVLFEDSLLPYFVDVVDFPRLKHEALRSHISRVGEVVYKKA